MTKEKKKILNYSNNTTSNKLIKFPKKITNNKKYESFNVLNKNGDSSIYTRDSSQVEKRGELHIINVVNILEELVDQIKSIQKSQALLRKDLVKAGVLKA